MSETPETPIEAYEAPAPGAELEENDHAEAIAAAEKKAAAGDPKDESILDKMQSVRAEKAEKVKKVAAKKAPAKKASSKPKLPEVASVHEKTVQKIANGDVKPRKRIRKRSKSKPRAKTTFQLKVDPRVMEKAKELAKGDAKRLQIVDETNVIVLYPGQKKFDLKEG